MFNFFLKYYTDKRKKKKRWMANLEIKNEILVKGGNHVEDYPALFLPA